MMNFIAKFWNIYTGSLQCHQSDQTDKKTYGICLFVCLCHWTTSPSHPILPTTIQLWSNCPTRLIANALEPIKNYIDGKVFGIQEMHQSMSIEIINVIHYCQLQVIQLDFWLLVHWNPSGTILAKRFLVCKKRINVDWDN